MVENDLKPFEYLPFHMRFLNLPSFIDAGVWAFVTVLTKCTACRWILNSLPKPYCLETKYQQIGVVFLATGWIQSANVPLPKNGHKVLYLIFWWFGWTRLCRWFRRSAVGWVAQLYNCRYNCWKELETVFGASSPAISHYCITGSSW